MQRGGQAAAGQSKPATPQSKHVISRINENQGLVRYAERAGKNPILQGKLDALTSQLTKGEISAPNHQLFGDVWEIKERGEGARVYYRKTAEGFEILAKSNKPDQPQVISILEKMYGN